MSSTTIRTFGGARRIAPKKGVHVTQKPSEMVALNADVVGYSGLIADDLEAMTATMDQYRVLDRIAGLGKNRGTLVNFVGDNFMAVFGATTDAMAAAIAITTEIEARNATVQSSRAVRFRMGMDQGVVSVSGGEYLGDALNIAARIQAIAPPGGISVSSRVYRALDEPVLRFRPTGRRHLKGIPEEVEIYELADLPTDAVTPNSHRSLALEAPSVAVLPISSQNADESVQATGDILRSDLIHRLSRIPQLKVIDAKAEPSDSGPRHSARYIIETGVHQAGEDVRVYAEVIDVASMNVVKVHKWAVKRRDLFGLSDELADEVARALEVDLTDG